MNKIIPILIIALLILPVVTAERKRFIQGDDINIRHTVELNGTLVDYANITIYDLQNRPLVEFEEMTKDLNDFNYTMLGNYPIGIYDYTVCGYTTTENECFGLEFEISPTGSDINVFPMQFFVILLGWAGVVVGKTNNKLRILKIFGAVMIMIVGLLTLYPGYNGIDHSTLLGMALGYTNIGAGFYFMVEDFFIKDEEREEYFGWD